MVLYHVISTYHLLNAITDRINNHNGEKAVVLISTWLVESFKHYEQLSLFFEKIIIHNAAFSINIGKQRFEATEKYFIDLFNQNGYELNDFDVINVFGAHYSFGYFLVKKNIPFIFWEDGAGILSRPEILENVCKNHFKLIFNEIKELGLLNGINQSFIHQVCNMKAQKYGFYSNKAIDFCVVEHLNQMNSKERNEIINFFCPSGLDNIPQNATLFLTQHFSNLAILSFEDHVLIYQLVMDYLMNEKHIIFKTHPDDIMYYNKLFPGKPVIRQKFPSELIPVVYANRAKEIATISSTAINNLKDYFEDVFELDTLYEKSFKATHRYYASMQILEELVKSIPLNVYEWGSNQRLLEKLNDLAEFQIADIHEYKNNIDINGIYILDDFNSETGQADIDVISLLETLPDSSGAILINSGLKYSFYDIRHKRSWENIVAVPIIKTKLERADDEDFYSDLQDEVVYFYSSKKEYQRLVREMRFSKVLDSTGIEISVTPMTDEQHRIRVLEGILEATEKRLLYCIERIKELEEMIASENIDKNAKTDKAGSK